MFKFNKNLIIKFKGNSLFIFLFQKIFFIQKIFFFKSFLKKSYFYFKQFWLCYVCKILCYYGLLDFRNSKVKKLFKKFYL